MNPDPTPGPQLYVPAGERPWPVRVLGAGLAVSILLNVAMLTVWTVHRAERHPRVELPACGRSCGGWTTSQIGRVYRAFDEGYDTEDAVCLTRQIIAEPPGQVLRADDLAAAATALRISRECRTEQHFGQATMTNQPKIPRLVVAR